MTSVRVSCVWVLVWLATAVASAQTPDPPSTAAPAAGLGSLDLAVNWRVRAEHWNWFEGDIGNGRYWFGHSQLRVSIGRKRRTFDWMFEGEQVALVGLPTDAVAPAPLGQLGHGASYYTANGNSENAASAFVKQAFVQFNGLGAFNLRLGRFEFFDGVQAKSSDPVVTTLVQTRIAHRLVSNFGFTAVQRTFDDAQLAWNSGAHTVTGFAARPTAGIFRVDGMPELDVQIYYGAYDRSIKTAHGAGSLRVFGAGYVDSRSSVPKTDNRPAAARAADRRDIAIGTWGADYVHVLHTASSGTFDILGWGVLQTGRWGSLTQRAGAFVAEAGWQQPASALQPWISAGYSYGSGDADPNDAQHGTFFQLMTTPRQYARFPFYNMMNNADAYATLNLHLAPLPAIRSEGHALSLADAADLWYLGGGAFERSTFGYQGRPGGGSRHLSTVWDISADCRLTHTLSATAYYARASAGGAIAGVYSRARSGQFAYVETTLHF